MRKIIVTEGKFDQVIVQRILSQPMRKQVEVVYRNGSTSAAAAARSYGINGNSQVLLLLNTHTEDVLDIAEKEQTYSGLLNGYSASSVVKLLLFRPEVEVLLFEDKVYVEQFFDRTLSTLEYDLLKREPKFGLARLQQTKSAHTNGTMVDVRRNLLDSMTEEQLLKIRQNPQVQEIIQYFQ